MNTCKFISLCIILCAAITFKTQGATILSQAQIAEKTGEIIARDNAIAAGDNVAHNTLIRQNQSHSFKNFLRHARDTLTQHSRNQTIIALRNVINNPQLKNIFIKDLEDGVLFLKKRLLTSEIMNQGLEALTPVFVPGAPVNQNYLNNINNLIVRIDSDGAGSGMLVPIPTAGDPAAIAARPITWRILTCAHMIPQSRLGEDSPILMGAHLPLGMPVSIRKMTVFKRAGRESTTYNGAVALPPNTLVFDVTNAAGEMVANNARALPRYENKADIAWCDLPDNNMLHNSLTLHLNVPNDPAAVGFPAIRNIIGGHQALEFKRDLADASITYRIHFVDRPADADNIVGIVNAANKHTNFISGFTNLIGGEQLTTSTARNAATELYDDPNFIDPTPTGHTEFMFFHDAPSHWGMSGGPIFKIDANNVEIFGIVKGVVAQQGGVLASQCQGTFLRFF